jgi:hypothetical protein
MGEVHAKGTAVITDDEVAKGAFFVVLNRFFVRETCGNNAEVASFDEDALVGQIKNSPAANLNKDFRFKVKVPIRMLLHEALGGGDLDGQLAPACPVECLDEDISHFSTLVYVYGLPPYGNILLKDRHCGGGVRIRSLETVGDTRI